MCYVLWKEFKVLISSTRLYDNDSPNLEWNDAQRWKALFLCRVLKTFKQPFLPLLLLLILLYGLLFQKCMGSSTPQQWCGLGLVHLLIFAPTLFSIRGDSQINPYTTCTKSVWNQNIIFDAVTIYKYQDESSISYKPSKKKNLIRIFKKSYEMAPLNTFYIWWTELQRKRRCSVWCTKVWALLLSFFLMGWLHRMPPE